MNFYNLIDLFVEKWSLYSYLVSTTYMYPPPTNLHTLPFLKKFKNTWKWFEKIPSNGRHPFPKLKFLSDMFKVLYKNLEDWRHLNHDSFTVVPSR